MLEALIGGATRLLGGFFGQQSADRANEIAQQTAAQNIALQREFAQNAIQWKVADAQRAGIHPLYALGASTASFSPVSVGVSGASPMAEALQGMGQDISRAAGAYRTAPARVDAVASAMQTRMGELSLENAEIRNSILKQQLARMVGPGNPPGVVPDTPFPVVESRKPEENPAIMIGGFRVPSDDDWSPTKAISDRWGDESLATNTYGNVRAARDLYRTFMPQIMARRAADMEAAQTLTRQWFGPNLDPRYRGYSIPRNIQ